MDDMIKNHIYKDYSTRARKFELSAESLHAYASLSKAARELLMDIIHRVGAGLAIEDLVVSGTYEDFGFKNAQAFSKYRKELSDSGFIAYRGKDHYVSPYMIGYNSRRQLDYIHRYFKIKKDPVVNMGQFNL